MMQQIFVVMQVTGTPYDETVTVICAFINNEEAEQYVATLESDLFLYYYIKETTLK